MQKGFEEGAYDSLLDIAGYPKAGTVPARTQAAPQPAAPPAEAAEARPAEDTADAGERTVRSRAPGATGIRTRK